MFARLSIKLIVDRVNVSVTRIIQHFHLPQSLGYYSFYYFNFMTIQCMLCAEDAEFIGVGECNHEPICFRCIYKMRVISKNNLCPICKISLKNIVIMEEFRPYQSFKEGILPDKHFVDVFYSSEAGRNAFQKLTEFKCFIKMEGKPCKVDKKFPSVAFLKKHLKDDHNRYVCQICVQKKTCVLEEQKLYTYKALSRHLEKGDIDEFGNITFLHPFCTFCNKHFFDEDEFRVHINLQHFICNVCGKQQRYRYYKNYDSLQIHFKISHYICNDENCLAKKFIAFKNAEELKLHRRQQHDQYTNKKIDMRELCGFQYEGHNPDDEIVVIKDKEGVDMEDQFLNLKKCKNKALGEADQQTDALLDLRTFYECRLDDDQHFEQAFILKHRSEESRLQTQNNKKRKYVQKAQMEKEKPIIARQNEKFYFQELQLLQTLHINRLSYEDFQEKLRNVLTNQDIARLNGSRVKMNKKQLKPNQFFEQFLQIMKKVSLRSAYLIFPHFIRTVNNDDLKVELDSAFALSLKRLPAKAQNLLLKCQTYCDLFKLFVKEIESNIESRIINGKISIKKPVRREKERLFQIMGVVRRLKIEEMAKFKFATNFGLQKSTVNYVIEKIFKGKLTEVQANLQSVSTEELLDLYTFMKFCFQAIKHSKNMHLEKNKIHENVLEDFLFEHPQLEKQFGIKKTDLKNIDEQIEFQKLMEERSNKQTLKEMQKKNEKKGFVSRTDFNLVDKGDFPDLVMEKKEEVKREQKFREVIQNVKEKPATYQKKINEMFPTLGTDTNQPKKQQIKTPTANKQESKAWWEKINDGKKPTFEEDEEQRVRVRKGNKKEKWVRAKGVFG